MAGVLFEDIFNVKDIDPEGKKFDRGKSITFVTSSCVYKQCCAGILGPDAKFVSVERSTF